MACREKQSCAERQSDWSEEPSVCVVMAAAGYPEAPEVGSPIHGIDGRDRRNGISGRNAAPGRYGSSLPVDECWV